MNTVTPKQARGIEKDKIANAITALGGTVIERGPDARRKMIVADFTGAERTIFITISMDDNAYFVFGAEYVEELKKQKNAEFYLIKYTDDAPVKKYVLRGEALMAILKFSQETYRAKRLVQGVPVDRESIVWAELQFLAPYEVAI